MSLQQKIQQAVNKYAVLVFSKTYCPYCRNAKNLLEQVIKNEVGDTKLIAGYRVYELDEMNDVNNDFQATGQQIQDQLKAMTGQRTVPNIFINSKHVGGCDDIVALNRKGQLVTMLKEAAQKSNQQ
ncbi:hypothetical protein MIR68_006422 [Amoeboaphelidium protococcarum]|nr:hypothetical protein MIR68_006422 [Amoeboaphelidium protococcarum]